MNFGQSLDRLADFGSYPNGAVSVRWGQLMRQTPELSGKIDLLTESRALISLDGLGTFHSGVVTRANGFFIVRELPFDEIPRRLHVTRGDMQRIAVVMDAMGVVHKIEREYLRPIIKGPEQLEGAFGIRSSSNRLLDVRASKEELTQISHTGVLSYLKRGETVEYTTSADSLKGGIPAKRSQVKNRKPHWYSLQGLRSAKTRIVVPEHIDRRYVFTLVPTNNESVVIDTLYVYEPTSSSEAPFIHACMNSLLTWYQVELRGRSQHGEGVLKVKLPDYRGIRIGNPSVLTPTQRAELLEAFAKLDAVATGPSLDELGEPARNAFEVTYLRACGFENPEAAARLFEQELRALAGERLERKLSVADAKVSRRKSTNVAASVDAYAARVAAAMPSIPDPRDFVGKGANARTYTVEAPTEGAITIGGGLFDNGLVKAGEITIARTENAFAAEMVRAVLLIDRSASRIKLPAGSDLEHAHREWSKAARRWHDQFDLEFGRIASGISDPRTRATVRDLSLRTLRSIE